MFSKTSVVLLLTVALFTVGAVSDSETFHVDSLPENAEEIALEFLENFMVQRYPGEDITVGEPMRLYLPDSELNALDFPIAIHHEGKLTFDDLEYAYLQLENSKKTFLDYRSGLSGEQLKIANHDEDETHNSLYERIHDARCLYNNYQSIVIIFSQDRPHILTVHNPAAMFHWDTNNISFEIASEFVGFGVVDGHILTVYLGEDDNLSWFIVDKYELETFNNYEGVLKRTPRRIPPLEWAFFLELHSKNVGGADRGHQDDLYAGYQDRVSGVSNQNFRL